MSSNHVTDINLFDFIIFWLQIYLLGTSKDVVDDLIISQCHISKHALLT